MINIVVAHQGEAKPFIDHYGLQAEAGQGMSLFVTPSIRLLVMGQGRKNAEKSLGKLIAFLEAPAQQWWINFGLAGSSQFPVDTLVTIDQAGWRNEESLQQVDCAAVPDLPVSGCLSRDQPSADYPLRGVVDMEAAAIVTVLENAGNIKKAGIFKLVSDGPDLPVEALTPVMARACVERNANAICRACDGFIARYVSRGVSCAHP